MFFPSYILFFTKTFCGRIKKWFLLQIIFKILGNSGYLKNNWCCFHHWSNSVIRTQETYGQFKKLSHFNTFNISKVYFFTLKNFSSITLFWWNKSLKLTLTWNYINCYVLWMIFLKHGYSNHKSHIQIGFDKKGSGLYYSTSISLLSNIDIVVV